MPQSFFDKYTTPEPAKPKSSFFDKYLDEEEEKKNEVPSPTAPAKPSEGFLSRSVPIVKGLGHFGVTAARAMLLQDQMARNELGEGAIEPFKRFAEDKKSGFIPKVANLGAGLAGIDPDAIREDYKAGNLGALAGDVTVPLALAILLRKAGKVSGANVPGIPKPKVDVVPPVAPITRQITEFAGANPYTPAGELATKLGRQQRADALPKVTPVRGQFADQAQGISAAPVREGIFGPADLSNETALLEQSRLRPASRLPPRGNRPPVAGNPIESTLPPIDQPVLEGPARPPQLGPNAQTRFADLSQVPSDLDFVPEIKAKFQKWLIRNGLEDNAYNQSLFLKQKGIQLPPKPGSAVELPPVTPPPMMDFDSNGVNAGPDSATVPRAMGVQTVNPASRGKSPFGLTRKGMAPGEVTGRPVETAGRTRKVKVKKVDPKTGETIIKTYEIPINASPEIESAIIHEKIKGDVVRNAASTDNPLLATVPDRLRPPAPNVNLLRGMSEGYPKEGAIPIDRVQAAQKLGPTGTETAKALVDRMAGTLDQPRDVNFVASKRPIKVRMNKLAPFGKPNIGRNLESIPRGPANEPFSEFLDKYKKKLNEKTETRKTAEQLIAEKEKKAAEAARKEPTFMNAIRAIPDRVRKSWPYQAIYKGLGVSGDTELRRLGPAGEALADLMKDEDTASATHSGQALADVRKFRKLSKAEKLEVAEIMDGKKPVSAASSDKVKEAYTVLRSRHDAVINEAIQNKVQMKTSSGETIDIQKHQGEHWPHYYDEKLFEDLTSLENKLLKAGNSPAKVAAMLKNIREKGERFSPSQHTRDFNLDGYDMSFDALKKYHISMSRAIERAKRYGPKDVADPDSTISKLISKTTDPEAARQIVNDQLGRSESGTKAQKKAYRVASGVTAATKLSLQAISNMVDLAGSVGNLGARDTVKALKDILKDRHTAADYATKVGALNIQEGGSLVEGGATKWGKHLGINATEKLVRTTEALAGRSAAERAFAKAKSNPKFKTRLARFVDGPVDEVLKQDKLTEAQLEFASGRAAELVSGVPNRLTLSKAFYAKNPVFRIPLLLKRFAFINTKNMVDAVKAEPTVASKAKKAAILLAAYQVAGKASGDTKAAIKGLVSGDIEAALDARKDSIGTGNEAFDTIMANYMQSNFFGLPGDTVEGVARGARGKVFGQLGGAVGSDIDELITAGGDIIDKPEKKGRFDSLGKSVIKRTPYIGAGLSERWYPRDKKNPFAFSKD